ncbi:hypothetical protein NJT12_18985 [Flavobacterium sp. AC]|uniref:Lipoprotein n=1 Tax=Flavobacterium azizsancarii TaxID=2961580 RepID=A0ABT4WGK6_9FLAO|nr:hypothetical protein [Flavobacterium azizsancarii]MDA6071714.1 hypothetical protein [Flavobacterium azizsancarii]
MKKLLLISVIFILNSCAFVPSTTVKDDSFKRQNADDQERDFNLQVKTICFSEKNNNKEVEIEYELKNNSKLNVFDKKLKTYKLFFILKMKDGREIAKEKTIWSIIPPNTAIIEKEKVYISDYTVATCTTRLYINYK